MRLSAMNKMDLKLGCILALLEQGEDVNHPPLSLEQHRQVERMRELLNDVSKGTEGQKIINNIPHTICPMDNPFLSGNEDFFLGVFLNQHKDPVCIELATHLNKCYACFEIFSQVLHEYYHKREELINKTKD